MIALLDEQSVVKANAQFWEQMLAMTLVTVSSSEERCIGGGHILGTVTLDGVWKGRIEVRLAAGLAYAATAAMMMQAVDTVGEADVLDAIKEIANMIAGTLKSSLPRPCSMSVPESAVERAGFCDSAAVDTLAVAFRHGAGVMLVRVCGQECMQ
jgi:CheY-specific phosphatase CheX